MLKKLRFKFVLFSMIIVAIMLGVIFGLLYYSTSRSLEGESLRMMERIAMSPMHMDRPSKPQDDIFLPYFSIALDSDGSITELDGDYFDLSDTARLEQLIDAARETQARSGILKDDQLRFFRVDMPFGERIVFADTTSEQSTLHNLIKAFALIGSASFLVFLAISVLLARWAVKPVEQAWRQQKQFVADASHELKTPLTVIMTNAELLNAASCSPDERQQFTENILTASGQMRGLVEGLLELAKIDSGKSRMLYEIFSLSDAVSAAAMLFEPIFFEKEMIFSQEIEPDIWVNGNEAQLRQVTEILLDNASKYAAPEGETVLRLKMTQKKHCVLEVCNQGEPIGEEDLKNLFKRFYRVDKVRAMNHSYGLGLSIAQSICVEHRGRITAKSENGWNQFSVELPIRPSRK